MKINNSSSFGRFYMDESSDLRRFSVYDAKTRRITRIISEADRAALHQYLMGDLKSANEINTGLALPPIPIRPSIVETAVRIALMNWPR